MKKFTKEEIEGTRDYFKKKGFEEVEVTLGERNFSYFVLPQSLAPDLPDFANRCSGEPSDGYVLGVSDSIDERFRQYVAAHEFIEFTEIGMDVEHRCAGALEEELQLVPPEIKDEYVEMRTKFFRNLIEYCSKQPDSYTPADISEFKQSLNSLEQAAN